MDESVSEQKNNEAMPPPESRSLSGITKQIFFQKYLHWIFIVVLALFIYWEYDKYGIHDSLERSLQGLTDESRHICVAKLDTVCDDLRYIQAIMSKQATSTSGLSEEQIKTTLVDLTRYKTSYDQIRYLDVEGQELLRVNLQDNTPILVSDRQLQNKSHRPYFQRTISLPPETIYSSGLDLNQEHGKIEIPYKPVLRFATPVFDDDKKVCGIVVLNVLGKRLLEECRHILAPGLSQGSQLYMNLLGSNRETLMPSVAIKTGEVLSAHKADGMKVCDPISTVSIPAYEKMSHAGDYHVIKGEGRNILFVEIGIPQAVVRAAYNKAALRMLMISGPLVLGLIWAFGLLAQSHAKEKLLHVQIKHDAVTDALTGLHNRRHGLELLEQTRNRSSRSGNMFSLFGVDINNLKGINDTYGHKAGDELIFSIANAMKEGVRSYDIVCRMGGDEFIVVLPDTDLEAGQRILERIYLQVLKQGEGKFPPYGFSFSYGGVEELRGEYGNIDALLEAADTQMYEFKIAMKQKEKAAAELHPEEAS